MPLFEWYAINSVITHLTIAPLNNYFGFYVRCQVFNVKINVILDYLNLKPFVTLILSLNYRFSGFITIFYNFKQNNWFTKFFMSSTLIEKTFNKKILFIIYFLIILFSERILFDIFFTFDIKRRLNC